MTKPSRTWRLITRACRQLFRTQSVVRGALPSALAETGSLHSRYGHVDLCHQPAEFAEARSYGGMLVTFVIRMQKVDFGGE